MLGPGAMLVVEVDRYADSSPSGRRERRQARYRPLRGVPRAPGALPATAPIRSAASSRSSISAAPSTCSMASPDAQEAVFRAPDEQLSAVGALPVHGPRLRRGHPVRRAARDRAPAGEVPVERAAPEQDEGLRAGDRAERSRTTSRTGATRETKEFHDTFKELVLRTSTHCLMGRRVPPQADPRVRRALPRSRRRDLARRPSSTPTPRTRPSRSATTRARVSRGCS